MKKMLLVFVIGAAAGAGGYWYVQRSNTQSQLTEARDRVTYAAWKAGKSIKDFALEIKQELSRSGEVVRDKAKSTGDAISATAVTATLKSKLLAESGLRGVSVETADGVVTLTGEVASHEDIARAMKLALDTDGVRRVISRIQISAGK